MRKTYELAVLLLMLVPSTFGQIPKGDLFVGYSYSRSNLTLPLFPPDVGGIVGSGNANLNGWNAAIGGKLFPFVKLVGDFSGHSGSKAVTDQCGFILGCTPVSDELHSHTYHLLFGPRVHVAFGRLTPFVHALFGVGHTSEHTSTKRFSDSSSNFADAFGGGIDCRLLGPLGWRVQADFLQDRFFSTTEHNFRFLRGWFWASNGIYKRSEVVNKGQGFVIGGYTIGNPFDDPVFGYYEDKRLMYVAPTRNGLICLKERICQ